jgi:hypothetical protein
MAHLPDVGRIGGSSGMLVDNHVIKKQNQIDSAVEYAVRVKVFQVFESMEASSDWDMDGPKPSNCGQQICAAAPCTQVQTYCKATKSIFDLIENEDSNPESSHENHGQNCFPITVQENTSGPEDLRDSKTIDLVISNLGEYVLKSPKGKGTRWSSRTRQSSISRASSVPREPPRPPDYSSSAHSPPKLLHPDNLTSTPSFSSSASTLTYDSSDPDPSLRRICEPTFDKPPRRVRFAEQLEAPPSSLLHPRVPSSPMSSNDSPAPLGAAARVLRSVSRSFIRVFRGSS